MMTKRLGLGVVLFASCVAGVACGPADPADQAPGNEESVASDQQGVTVQAPLDLQQSLQRQTKPVQALSNVLKSRARTSGTTIQNLK